MKSLFNARAKRFKNSGAPINADRKLKHVIFIGIMVVTAIIVTVSKFQPTEEMVTVEDPIESYDNVVEIVIGDDGEIAESDESSSNEE